MSADHLTAAQRTKQANRNAEGQYQQKISAGPDDTAGVLGVGPGSDDSEPGTCPSCSANVDEWGDWTGECGAVPGPPEECDDCMACYCDFSC